MSFIESTGKARDLMVVSHSPGAASAHRIDAARVYAELAKAEAMYHLANAVGALVETLKEKSQ